MTYSKSDFGEDFKWGVAISSYQVEGAHDIDGKGPSIWDKFSHKGKRIEDGSDGKIACDFYNRYPEDIDLIKELNIDNFRFSLSWPRILPDGTGRINQAGIDYYNRVIDNCLEKGITPWLTLYHWDLPLILEQKGGWTKRMIVNAFIEYADVCSRHFGDRVKNWIVMNEPHTFTGLGYLLGFYAPGRYGLKNYIPAVHHATLCQAEGARVLRRNIPDANIGTSISCAHVSPASNAPRHIEAAKKVDVLFNRLHIEPLLGMDYPIRDLPVLERIEQYIQPYDPELIKFDFDFIGLQNYYSLVAYNNRLVPYLNAFVMPFRKLNRPLTSNGWEVYPEGMYKILKQFGQYPIKKIIVTENGAAYHDKVVKGRVNDTARMNYIQTYLEQVLRAKNDGINIGGYMIWSLMDNFEWRAGFKSRFGIVHTDFNTQKRIIKDSGLWVKEFLK
ncbi:MAG: GH1 family beta-glucosidase [Bacteroidales bacterium]|nr:GH1 family beta-glucosidase [Bacteroidales bacterium]